MVLTVGCLYYCEQNMAKCGIPVRWWLEIFFIMYFSRSSFQMIKILVLSYLYEWKTWYDIGAFTVTNGCMAGWLIYGFVLYYSDANDCDKEPETSFFISLMFVILFIGYMMMFIYLMLLCTVPCLYIA